MTMSIISPLPITASNLTASNALETDYAAWNASTNYTLDSKVSYLAKVYRNIMPGVNTGAPNLVPTRWAESTVEFSSWDPGYNYSVGDKVQRLSLHKVYQCSELGINAEPPEDNIVKWIEIGPTNRWGMFDRKLGTVTSNDTGNLTVSVRPGRVTGVALLGMVGSQATITFKDAPGGQVIRQATKVLDGTIITSIYDWFFSPYEQLADWAVTGLPNHYLSPEVTVSITSITGIVSCGVCIVGTATDVGFTQRGASAGIVDYSRKVVDDFGNYDVTERAYSKRNNISVFTEKVNFNKIFTKLASIRATPSLYIGMSDQGFEPFLVYGWYKSFDIVVEYPDYHLLNIEIEGLV